MRGQKQSGCEFGPVAANPRLRTSHSHRNASSRPGIAGSVEIRDGDVTRDSLVSQSDDVHRHAQLTISAGGGIKRFGHRLRGRRKKRTRQTEGRRQIGSQAVRVPVQPGLIVSGAQAIIVIGKGTQVTSEARIF